MTAPAALVGVPTPRVGTEPLRHLDESTSRGFSVAAFADQVLGEPLLPWQRELAVRALELNPDGTYRFRTVVCLVARQNGKTHLLKTLALWRIYVARARLVVGAAQSLGIAKEAWRGTAMKAEATPALRPDFVRWYRDNNDPHILFANDARYKVVAATRRAGRGLSVDLLIMDEVREQRDWGAWAALSGTTAARAGAQTWCISNAGDDESMVLNQLRAAALAGRDPSMGLFEWSAPKRCDLDDTDGWVAANPGLGHVVSEQAIRSALATDPPAVFRTERLCQRVETTDGALDVAAWRDCRDAAASIGPRPGESGADFEARRGRLRIAACFDVAPDGEHATLAIAAREPGGRVRVEVAGAWRDTVVARRELPALLGRIRPAVFTWFSAGPAAALAPLLAGSRADLLPGAPSRATKVEELKGNAVTAACMGFADLVRARHVLHPGDPLLDAHISGAAKLHSADGWRFTRRGVGHADAVYAAAGAVHAAMALPATTRGEEWIGVVI